MGNPFNLFQSIAWESNRLVTFSRHFLNNQLGKKPSCFRWRVVIKEDNKWQPKGMIIEREFWMKRIFPMELGFDGLLGLPYDIVYKSTLKYFACFCNKLSNKLFYIFVFPIHVAIRDILERCFLTWYYCIQISV